MPAGLVHSLRRHCDTATLPRLGIKQQSINSSHLLLHRNSGLEPHRLMPASSKQLLQGGITMTKQNPHHHALPGTQQKLHHP